jgi:hypothetical protein
MSPHDVAPPKAAPPTAAPPIETIPPGEAEAVRIVTDVSLAVLDERARPVRRGQHPKHHGLVRGTFTVHAAIPDALRHGLFREAHTFEAVVRFSNGRQQDDRKKDAHGMAIKLLDVPGDKLLEPEREATTHDFIAIDYPVFFIRDAGTYAQFSLAVQASQRFTERAPVRWLPAKLRDVASLLHLAAGFLRTHAYERRLIQRFGDRVPTSPLTPTYHSCTPYALGPHAIRFRLRPLDAPPRPQAPRGRDFLRDALVAALRDGEAAFAFEVQRQGDPRAMPVEDPTIPWPESAAPFVHVATLRLPAQAFDSPGRMEICENLSFTPWHALPEHRPVGGINRIRRVVYEVLARRRHDLNGVPAGEPGPHWLRDVWERA